jgi:hypothetical protein
MEMETKELICNVKNCKKTVFFQCSTGMRPPRWGSRPPHFPRPRDRGTPGETFPMSPFWGVVTPQGGERVSPNEGLLGIPP